jgi:hypothetical protein
MLDILKRHFSNFKNDSDHIIVKYSLYNHTTIDLIQLFKKEHKLKGGNLHGFFFSLINDYRE